MFNLLAFANKDFLKKILCIIILYQYSLSSFAQLPAGNYSCSGYFFHPTTSRALNLVKSLTQISASRYQIDLGDLGTSSYTFQFDVDANNNLVNWSAVGATPVAPASGFMTSDNPGNISFPVAPGPGTSPFVQSTYNNTYDPVTKTLYLHYGYAVGAASESGYSRQIYEKLIFIAPPEIFSVNPATGTSQSQITIKGRGFSFVKPYNGISFGGINSDSAIIESDTVITAWPGSGNSGNVILNNGYVKDTFANFTYTPPTQAAITPWQIVGSAGFSQSKADWVNVSVDKYDNPYVVFTDSSDGKARVKKFAGTWQDVGGTVSDGKCSKTTIAIDTSGKPVVAYIDSSNGGYVVVKRFDGSNWINLNMQLRVPARYFGLLIDTANNMFIPVNANQDTGIAMNQYTNGTWSYIYSLGSMPRNGYELRMAVGRNNLPYIMYVDNSLPANRTRVSVKGFNGFSWQYTGTAGFSNIVSSQYSPSISVDTSGNPVVTFVDDSTFQRLSVYKFDGTNWNNDKGKSFSKGRSWFPSLNVDKRDAVSVVFIDSSYNNQGTVLTYNKISNTWKTTGSRGAIPFKSLDGSAMITDSRNRTLIAFPDATQNGKVSVIRLVKDFIWIGGVSNAWENPANWNTGEVPNPTSNVFINGGTVVLSSNTTINSISVSPGASFTIQLSFNLTVTGP